jgi:predicted Zn-dependent protease
MSESEEMKLGLASFEQMKEEVPISRDAAANALLQKVGQRIAAVAEMPNAQWEFVLFDSEQPNAFCLPGGKVGVYTGILPITLNEAGLATVIGHEVAHAKARHGGERMSQQVLLQTGGSLLNLGLSAADPTIQAASATVYGWGSQLGYSLPHSRKQESEADYIGLLYMARAGYRPEESIAFWKRFQAFNEQHGGGQDLWFLSTHPLDSTRIKQIQNWIPEAEKEFRPAQ